MATSTSPRNGGLQIHSEALNKIVNVPLVHAPLNFAYNTIEAYPVFSRPYHFGENVFNETLKVAEPITSRFNGQLHFLDNQAVKALNFAESKWAYPFKVTPEQIAAMPKAVIQAYADAVQKAWNQRVQPGVDQATAKFDELKNQNQVLQSAVDAVAQLQDRLAKALDNLKKQGSGTKNGDKAASEAKGIVNNIFAELEKVRNLAGSLPVDARKRFEPVLDSFGQTYSHINAEFREGSGPMVQRLQNILNYLQEEALPAMRKAALDGHSQPVTVNGAPASK